MYSLCTVLFRIRPGAYLFRSPFRHGTYLFHSLFWPAIIHLFTTSTSLYFTTTENVSSIKKDNFCLKGTCIALTEEYPNVTVCYRLKRTFFNRKFDQICPKMAIFLPFFSLQNPQKVLSILQLISREMFIELNCPVAYYFDHPLDPARSRSNTVINVIAYV